MKTSIPKKSLEKIKKAIKETQGGKTTVDNYTIIKKGEGVSFGGLPLGSIEQDGSTYIVYPS